MNYQQGYRPPSQAPQNIPPPLPPSRQGGAAKKRASHPLLWVLVPALIAACVFLAVRGYQVYDAQQKLTAEVEAVQNVFLPNIYVDDIPLGGLTAQEGIDAVVGKVNARQGSWSLQLTYQGHTFYTLDYSTLGIHTDISQVYSLLQGLYQKGKTGTLQERKQEIDQFRAEPYYAYTTQSDLSTEQLDYILSLIQAQLTYDPSDAYVAYFYPDLSDPFIIQGESYGSALDVDELKKQILSMAASGQGGALEIQPQVIPPKVTEADVRNQVALLCKATTPVSSTSTPERTSNIRVAFSRLNGQTVAPGDKFSFNKITLDRTLKNGYKYAIEYESGLEVLGVGGGVCQASTTLYLAALQSNLEIVDRISHSDPVSYTIFGQDATVVYGKHDFSFRNNSGGTLYITARVEETGRNKYQCVVCIYGPTLGQGVSYKLRTETIQTLPAPLEEIYRQDTNHTYVTYKDEEPYLVRKARDGYVNDTYLQRWENGKMVSESFVSRDTCKAREAVYVTGTLNR